MRNGKNNSKFSILNSQFGLKIFSSFNIPHSAFRIPQFNFKGFSLFELIIVIIIMGMLAAAVSYKIGSLKTYSVTAETDILKANLRYAQYRALSDADKTYGGSNFTWGVSLSGDSYTLQRNPAATATTNFPGEISPTRYLPSGISITTGAITYDAYGRPTGNLTITVSDTDGTFETITVTPNTGFIP